MPRFDFSISPEQKPVWRQKKSGRDYDSDVTLDQRPITARGRITSPEIEELPEDAISALPEEQTFWVKEDRGIGTDILAKEKIGEGFFGTVYVAEILIGKKRRRFVIKEFKNNEISTGEKSAEQAIKNYTSAKNAGLKVWPTYRLNREGRQILMTNGNLDDSHCWGSNSILEEKKREKIERIDNLEELAESMYQEAMKASKMGITLHVDAFFFLFKKNDPHPKIDFLIGDFDNVQKCTDMGNQEKNQNIRAVNQILVLLLRSLDNQEWADEQRRLLDEIHRKYYNQLFPRKKRFKK